MRTISNNGNRMGFANSKPKKGIWNIRHIHAMWCLRSYHLGSTPITPRTCTFLWLNHRESPKNLLQQSYKIIIIQFSTWVCLENTVSTIFQWIIMNYHGLSYYYHGFSILIFSIQMSTWGPDHQGSRPKNPPRNHPAVIRNRPHYWLIQE